jgi:hypothetical protein
MPITPSQAENVLLYAPYGSCVVLVGKPGSAKSAVNYRAAKRAGAVYIGKYTADMDVLDGKGIPYLIEGADGKKIMSYAPVGDWPTDAARHLYPESSEIRVNLDDWGQSPPPVKRQTARAIYGDGTERMLGNNLVLSNVLFSATTNSVEDRAGVFATESYAQNRVVDVRVEPDVDEWCSGAIAGWPKPTVDEGYAELRAKINKAVALGVPDSIIAYAKWNKSVSNFDPSVTVGPFMSQRSLTELGKFMRAFEAAGINGTVLHEVTCGCLGEAEAVKFSAFNKLRDDLPDTDALLRGEDVALPPRTEVLYILVTTVVRAARKEHVNGVGKLLRRLAEVTTKDGAHVGVEVSAYMLGECLYGACSKEMYAIRSHPDFIKWVQVNHRYFTDVRPDGK